MARLWQRFGLGNLVTGERKEDVTDGIPPDGEGFDPAFDRAGLVEPVGFAQGLDAALVEQLVARLFEREGTVLALFF